MTSLAAQEKKSPLLDLNQLNGLDNTQFSTFNSLLFEYMINVPTNSTTEPHEKFTNFMSAEGLKKGFETLFFNLIEHLLAGVRHNRNAEYIYSTTKENFLQEEYAIQLKSAYGRHLSVITTLFDENIFKLSKLIDLEWRFGVTTANSSLNTVGTCFLQLKLSTIQNGEKKNVIVEMTLSQFYSFLSSLQQAANEIQQS